MSAAATYPDPVTLIASDREQLTHLLRGLAARLDQLDRRLADLAWNGRGFGDLRSGLVIGEMTCERTALESERERLGDRLAALAGQLNALDSGIHRRPEDHARVGTCPYCGYPSLGSGLCAFCRPDPMR